MKILYAVQATGNGHISRAMELLPYLQEKGNVDIFLSGSNSSLPLEAPVKYRSQGLSLFYKCDGGLDYWRMTKAYSPLRLRKEINELPVEQYELVLNDFDYITSAACAKKGVPSINFGHQASFASPHTPRPASRNKIGEWILTNYAKAQKNAGLHFDRYDDFIFTPVIKKQVLEARPTDGGYVTVYLPAYCEPQLRSLFNKLPDFRFEIFSRETTETREEGHLTFKPVNKTLFSESLIHCTGIITGGGFETPAEALHLGKKLLCIPIRGQYEQVCNAAALQKMNITTLEKLDELFPEEFYNWIYCKKALRKDYSRSIPDLLNYVFA